MVAMACKLLVVVTKTRNNTGRNDQRRMRKMHAMNRLVVVIPYSLSMPDVRNGLVVVCKTKLYTC